MPGKKISDFVDAVTLQSTDYLVLDRGSSTLRLSGGDIATKSELNQLSATVMDVVPSQRGGAGNIQGLLKANGLGIVSAALPNIDYATASSLDVLSAYATTNTLNGLSAFVDGNFAIKTDLVNLSAFVDSNFATISSLSSYATNLRLDNLSAFADVNFATNTRVTNLSSFVDATFATNTIVSNLSSFASVNFATNTRVTNLSSFVDTKFIPNPSSTIVTGYVLTWDGSAWVAAAASTGTGTINLTGDITSVGASATYNNVVPSNKGGAGTVNGIMKADGGGTVSAAVAGTDYVIPSALSSYAKLSSLSSYATLTGLATKIDKPASTTTGYVLTWNGSAWVAAAPTGTTNLTGDITSIGAATTYNNVVPSTKGGAGTVNGIMKANGSGTVSAAVAGTDYVIPSALSSYATVSSLTGYAPTSNLSNHLPLSGGTLTGNLTIAAPIVRIAANGVTPPAIALASSTASIGNGQLTYGFRGAYYGKANLTGSSLISKYQSARTFEKKLDLASGLNVLTDLAMSKDGRYGYALATHTSSNFLSVYTTEDSGQTWTLSTFSKINLTGSFLVTTNADGSLVMYASTTGNQIVLDVPRQNSLITTSYRDLVVPFDVGTRTILDLAMSYDGRVLVIASNQGLHISKDYGYTWTKANTLSLGIKNVAISSDGKYMLAITNTSASAKLLASSSYGEGAFSYVGTSNVYNSVDVSADGRQQIAVGQNIISRSTDWAINWSDSVLNGGSFVFSNVQVLDLLPAGSVYTDITGAVRITSNAANPLVVPITSGLVQPIKCVSSSDGNTIVAITSDGTAVYTSYADNQLPGNFEATGEIKAGGKLTGTSISGTSLTSSSTISAAGSITGTNITGTSLTITGNISAAGSITSSSLTVYGNVSATGDVIGFATLSDERLKDNVTIIPNALEKITSIKGVSYEWNTLQDVYHGNDVGVIAQDIEQILPQAVVTRDNGYKAVKYDRLIPLLIEAVKELKEEIAVLKSSK